MQMYTINKGDRLFQICAGNLEPIEFQLVNELSNTQGFIVDLEVLDNKFDILKIKIFK